MATNTYTNVNGNYPAIPQQQEYYIHEASGNVLFHYTRSNQGTLSIVSTTEQARYSSERLGAHKANFAKINGSEANYSYPQAIVVANMRQLSYRRMNHKQYELKGYLGNIRATISDYALAYISNSSGALTFSNTTADQKSMYNYYSFGMPKPNKYNACFATTVYEEYYDVPDDNYRYGFNGQEKDNEVKGAGNSLDFGARIYDSRLGKWLALDPLQKKYPSLSAYNFVGNNPIVFVDPDGKKIRIYLSEEKYYDYTPGTLPKGAPAIVQKVHEAISYSMNAPIAASMWNTLSKVEEVVDIRPGDDVENRFESALGTKTSDGKDFIGTIYWDYNSPIDVYTTANVEDSWSYVKGSITPTTTIAHEGGHAWLALAAFLTGDLNKIAEYKLSGHERFGYDADYDDKDERKNTTNFEETYIRQINKFEETRNPQDPLLQPIRYNHRGSKPGPTGDVKSVNDLNPQIPDLYKQWRSEQCQKGKDVNDGAKNSCTNTR